MNTVAVMHSPPAAAGATHTLLARVADTSADKTACLRLRYDTFAAERGTRLVPNCAGLDSDYFDKYCQHLMVRNSADGVLAAYARLLTDTGAYRAGLFYSQSAFEMGRVLNHRSRFLEASRLCLRPEHRNTTTVDALVSGFGNVMEQHRADYLLVCVGIPLGEDGATASCALEHLRQHHLASEEFRVFPKRPYQGVPTTGNPPASTLPLLVASLVQRGARLCGEAYWDKRLNTADALFVLTREQVVMNAATRQECA